MTTRLSATQEEILATLRRVGEPMQFKDVLADVRERVAAGVAHHATARDMQEVLQEWGGLADMGRIRRVRKDSVLWELVPRVEIEE